MFMAMARDGLLPSLFSEISEHTQVPVKSTIIIGILAAVLAFVMDVSQLAGMVNYAFELEIFLLGRIHFLLPNTKMNHCI